MNTTHLACRAGFALGALALALCSVRTAWAQTNAPTQLPVQGAQLRNATITVSPTAPGQMTINQGQAPRAYIEWSNFSIGSDASVSVIQPGVNAVLLNRVVGSGTAPPISRIDGALNATGQVFILNPAGIVFGAGSQVQVGSLVAAAMDTSTSADAFLQDGALALGPGGSGTLRVEPGAGIGVRAGQVSAGAGGDLVLIAPGGLTMDGALQASGARVLLAVSGATSVPGTGIPVGSSGFITLQLTPAAAGTLQMQGRVNVAGIQGINGSVRIEAPTIAIGNRTGSPATDVVLQDAQITALGSAGPGLLTISGSSAGGVAVDLMRTGLSGDRIELRGSSLQSQANADLQTIGVRLDSVQIDVGTGSLLVAGRGELAASLPPTSAEAIGVGLNDLAIRTAPNAGRAVNIVGESVNSIGAGIGAVNDGGFTIGSTDPDQPSAAAVLLGADAGPQGRAFQLFGAPSVATTAFVNLRPAGVDANGQVQEHLDAPISLGGGVSAAPLGFNVPSDWLLDARLTSNGGIASAGLVIGSSSHRGAISVAGDALQANLTPRLSLQNGGAGSQGIVIQGSAGAARELALVSAGAVTQTGPLAAEHLVLTSPSGTGSFTLLDSGNAIDQLSFAGPSSVQVASAGSLAVAAGSWAGYDISAGTGSFSEQPITTSQAAQQVLLRTNEGTLSLQQGIEASGAGARIDLVAEFGDFQNPGNASLRTGAGGVWRVWSDSWTGSQRGDLATQASAPNLYGCSYGDSGLCSASQIVLPTTGSGFLYAAQPDLVITPVPVAASRGTFLPPLSFSAAGLVNGDSTAQALAGTLATPANLLSPPGPYAVLAGSLQSPTGYRLSLASSAATAVTITPPDPLRPTYSDGLAQLLASSASETLGRNLATPRMCLASGSTRALAQDEAGADLLGLEWARVRQQPQFSSCLEIERGGGACAGF